ncbi:MAG: hypothetical protein ACOY32_07835 [Thermodesulfobacteriota bacterium]
MNNKNVFLRLFAEEPSEEAAHNVADRILDLLKGHALHLDIQVKKYWKIPEYYEIFFRLSPLTGSSDIISEIASILGKGWEKQQASLESIWNPGPESSFKINSVRWAHIEIVEQ